jgi:hypothetical protein
MPFVSISDTARRLGEDARMVRRWVKSRALSTAPGVNGRQLIDEDERASVKRDLQRVVSGKSDDLAVLTAKVALIGEELAVLWQRVADLETQVAGQQPKAPRTRVMRDDTVSEQAALTDMPASRPSTSHALPNGLREGLVIATNFAHEHFPAMTVDQISKILQTLRENRSVPMIVGTFKMGKVTTRYTLDAAGRRAFCEVAWEREGFSFCLQDPHLE